MRKRVVVTGLGVISPVGNNVDAFWSSLRQGVCGIDRTTSFDITEFDSKVSGQVKDFDEKVYMDRKIAKRMDRFSHFAIAATKEALDMSGLDLEKEDLTRIGVIIGSGIGSLGTIEIEEQKLIEKGPSKISPMLIPKIIANIAAGNVAIRFGLKGMCTCVVTACASGTNSIGDAFRAIQYGTADVMVAGGTESSICPLGIAGFTSLTALSTTHDPLKASRPFDKNRNGFVLGEGAGTLILEELDHALNRGANILAEVSGYGATCDAYHLTSPSPDGEGAARCMELAIADGGVSKEDISYINAHGTSTEYNDKFETIAIKRVFGDYAYKIPVSSTKSMTGHLLGAAGAIEAVACVKSINDNYVHPTIGYETPDEDCDLDYVPNFGREVEVNCVLTNSLGFGGHNATLLFKKYK
ncbi:MAG: beta-ketoacyl-[acyl-carrier-protein] synthase II [Firmicutes bacterium HGW-Firmicutes-1]|jgi:3-oxoacyl-[acyl-carrier-protein] synthase II|nr:MAG: beta-ketoacyl-[acyl-carrier-protein] synthase II [Firmicutes bacterium HGW-Firmicutes-1]